MAEKQKARATTHLEVLDSPKPRRPIAVSTHLEADPNDQRITLRITTLAFDDGTVWRHESDGWAQIYTLGDEEKSA